MCMSVRVHAHVFSTPSASVGDLCSNAPRSLAPLDLSSGPCPHGHPTTPARPQVQRPEPEDIKQRADNPGPADYADPAPPWAKLGKSGVAVKIGTEEQRPWPIHPETLTKIAQPDDMPGSPDCPRVTRRE